MNYNNRGKFKDNLEEKKTKKKWSYNNIQAHYYTYSYASTQQVNINRVLQQKHII